MDKHTQTIRGEQPINCLSRFDPFVRFSFKELMLSIVFLGEIHFQKTLYLSFGFIFTPVLISNCLKRK